MKLRKLLFIIPLIVFFSSCEDFLKEDPKGRLDESYLRTEGGMEQLAIAMYGNAHLLVNPIHNLVNAGTDEVTFSSSNSAVTATLYQTDKMLTFGSLEEAWQFIYKQINDCNFGLAAAQEVDFSTDSKKEKVISELSFFRAWLYWIAVEFWGEGAHYSDTPTEGVITEGYQTTIDIFYKLIIDDLDNAIAMLPATSQKVGEVNSGVAKAMKARALMSLAQYSDDVIGATGHYSNKTAVYTAAKALADELIASGSGYKLLNNFADIFTIQNENNEEIIWALQMTTNATYRCPENLMSKEFTAYPIFSLRDIKSLASGYGLYEHSAWYGRSQCNYIPTYYYATLFDVDDKRCEGTFETVYQKLWNPATLNWGDMGVPLKDGNPTDTVAYRPMRVVDAVEAAAFKARGIYCDGLNMIYTGTDNAPGGNVKSNQRKYANTITKFLDRTRLAPKQDNGGTDIILFRLAEQYLIAAECAYFLTGGNAAKIYLDTLRERARSAPGTLVVTAGDIDIDYILDERTRELGAELIRWFDLKRTGRWSRIKTYNPDATFFDATVHSLKPIPNNELERIENYPATFKQNPNYPSRNDEGI